MAIEMNKSPSVRLTPGQEIKLAKPATELYIGQVLKTVVVTALTNNQVLININGQNLNAQSSHRFMPGELLEVKVIANKNETVLEVQQKNSSLSILQNALLQTLPKQTPPSNLLNGLNQLINSEHLPYPVTQQIKAMLNNIITLAQLPQQLMRAVHQSGVFMESTLLEWQKHSPQKLKADFKGQCFSLLSSLPADRRNNGCRTPDSETLHLAKDPLPLPGAIPQPLSKNSLLNLLELSPEALQHVLRDQVSHVLSRITANQINHLTNENKEGYLLMLDLPVKINEHIDVIPLMIKQHKAEPMQQSKWSLSFALNLPQLGALQASVSLHAKTIDIKMNTELSASYTTLEGYQSELREILSLMGLELRHWKLQIGLEDNQIDVVNLRLLDIRI
ncbi:flagellar hook-length control protein FliK [uncultured Legionella sp.]|uniref:flagellar hook-length control protein FliK n=1 Tax=uncultured Legionella sp. TaxID=210934 RepID=UPI002614D12E|nr:flagellar hook-length control protein FliK [uncultured Legionella sp.]